VVDNTATTDNRQKSRAGAERMERRRGREGGREGRSWIVDKREEEEEENGNWRQQGTGREGRESGSRRGAL
jgi:hypothetical protein